MNGYLIDTNVLGELRKPRHRASENVLEWWQSVRGESLFLSVMVLGEVRRGIDLLKARDPVTAAILDQWLAQTCRAFTGRILDIGMGEAMCWGSLSAIRTLPQIDGLLAATALHRDLTLVSRNTKDFQDLGIRLFNPFTGESA